MSEYSITEYTVCNLVFIPCTLYTGKFIFVHVKPLCIYKWEAFIIPTIRCEHRFTIGSVENCTCLGYYAAIIGHFLPTFRDNLSVPSWGLKSPMVLGFGLLNPEGGTDRLSRNVGKKLPLLVHNKPRRPQFSAASWRKSEITYALFLANLTPQGIKFYCTSSRIKLNYFSCWFLKWWSNTVHWDYFWHNEEPLQFL